MWVEADEDFCILGGKIYEGLGLGLSGSTGKYRLIRLSGPPLLLLILSSKFKDIICLLILSPSSYYPEFMLKATSARECIDYENRG